MMPNFRVTQFGQAIAFGVAILGMNLAIGYAGLLSLGHIAFMGTGAYMTMILVNDYGWDYWMSFFAAVVVCFVFGLIVGLPALRIKGLYLALATFALAYTFPIILKIEQWGIARRTGGDNGRTITRGAAAAQLGPTTSPRSRGTPRSSRRPGSTGASSSRRSSPSCWSGTSSRAVPAGPSNAMRDNQIGAAVSGVNLSLLQGGALRHQRRGHRHRGLPAGDLPGLGRPVLLRRQLRHPHADGARGRRRRQPARLLDRWPRGRLPAGPRQPGDVHGDPVLRDRDGAAR